MKAPKIPASSFPKISDVILSRIIEEWSLPRKNQALPRRSVNARKLAMRLRMDQSSLRGNTVLIVGEGGTWQNVSDYLNAAMRENDFKTLEAFCEGFLEFTGNAFPVAEGEAGILQQLTPQNDPASLQRVEIARAILILQERKGFPPYQCEIVDFLGWPQDHRPPLNISAAEVSKILKEGVIFFGVFEEN